MVFWKQIQVDTDREGEDVTRTIPLLRYFNVFNVQQCEGRSLSPIGDTPTVEPIKAATAIVDGMPNRPGITLEGLVACYTPREDVVYIPEPERFERAEAFYSTFFHELTHSTGHRSRLARPSASQSSI